MSMTADPLALTALCDLMKTRYAQRRRARALKRLQTPAVNLTAAVSASLVSAAAEENEAENGVDPLAALIPVDALPVLTDDCLPGALYEDAAAHDHHGSGTDHHAHMRLHDRFGSDPFASRLESPFSQHHDSHDTHDESHAALHDGEAVRACPVTAAASYQGHGDGEHAGWHHGTHGHHHAASGERDHAHGAAPAAVHHEHHGGQGRPEHHNHHQQHANHAGGGHDGHGAHHAHAQHGSHASGSHGADAAGASHEHDLEDGLSALAESIAGHDHDPVQTASAQASESPSSGHAHHGHHTHGETYVPPVEDLSAPTAPLV